jgi:transcription antitermination factor NusG
MDTNTLSVRPPSGVDEKKWCATRWFALYTRSRHEKVAERELNKKGFETFLPLRKVVRQWSDRKKTVEEPLFKGYLFVRASLSQRWSVLNSAGVVRFVTCGNEPAEVPEKELWAIQRFVEENIEVDPFPYLKTVSENRGKGVCALRPVQGRGRFHPAQGQALPSGHFARHADAVSVRPDRPGMRGAGLRLQAQFKIPL